jgi:hypothetical protein
MANVVALLKSLKTLAREQQQVIGRLEREVRALNGRNGTAPRLAKRLHCPRCSRRFALPVHLGRHLSATHHRKLRPR